MCEISLGNQATLGPLHGRVPWACRHHLVRPSKALHVLTDCRCSSLLRSSSSGCEAARRRRPPPPSRVCRHPRRSLLFRGSTSKTTDTRSSCNRRWRTGRAHRECLQEGWLGRRWRLMFRSSTSTARTTPCRRCPDRTKLWCGTSELWFCREEREC